MSVSATQQPTSAERQMTYWKWRVLLCVMGCYLFYYTGRLVIGHALPLMRDDLGYNEIQLGWLASILFACYSIGQAVNGNLGDRLGGRLMIAAGAVASMLFCWMFSVASGLAWLMILWGANGFAQSMGWAPGGRMLSNWWPHRQRGIAFGLYMLAAGLSAVLVWGTSRAVLDLFDSSDPGVWRWLFRLPVLGLGIAGVIFYILVHDRPEDVGLDPIDDGSHENDNAAAKDTAADVATESLGSGPGESTGVPHGRYARVLLTVPFLVACGVIFMQSFARYGLLTWIPIYYKDSGLDIKDSLVITVALPIGMGIGAFAGGFTSDRVFGSRRTVVVALFLSIGAISSLALWATPVSAEASKATGIAMLFVAGFFVYGAQGPLWALCPDLVGTENAGTAVGVMDAVAYAGAFAQGPILGYCINHGNTLGYSAVFLVLTSACGIGATLAAVIRR